MKSTYDMILEEGEERGIEKGIEKGHKLGLKQGEAKGSSQTEEKIVLNMFLKGISVDEITSLTGIDQNDVQRIIQNNHSK